VASTDRCGRIVRTLLRYSRDEPAEKQCCSINDVAKQAIDLTRSYAERCGAKVWLERASQTPLAPMNPLEIEMVLVNLIRNAIQASGEKPEILVHTAWNATSVRASVSDHGCGMTTEQIAHMFDPLYTTHSETGGVGMGLAITSGIIQRHHGSIEVQSHPGDGTTITVNLPIATGLSEGETM
jgi:two-component system, NtrC family, sensor kinase